MQNRLFSQLTDDEKVRKLDIAIRRKTGNLLDAEKVGSLNRNISLKHQYAIAVHRIKCGSCRAIVANNTLHIIIPV